MDDDEGHGPLPTPGTLPPSHPTPSQVGDGLGRVETMLSLGGCRAPAAVLPSMSLAELLDHFSRSEPGAGSSYTTASSRTSPVQIFQPKISNLGGQLRTAWYVVIDYKLLDFNLFYFSKLVIQHKAEKSSFKTLSNIIKWKFLFVAIKNLQKKILHARAQKILNFLTKLNSMTS